MTNNKRLSWWQVVVIVLITVFVIIPLIAFLAQRLLGTPTLKVDDANAATLSCGDPDPTTPEDVGTVCGGTLSHVAVPTETVGGVTWHGIDAGLTVTPMAIISTETNGKKASKGYGWGADIPAGGTIHFQAHKVWYRSLGHIWRSPAPRTHTGCWVSGFSWGWQCAGLYSKRGHFFRWHHHGRGGHSTTIHYHVRQCTPTPLGDWCHRDVDYGVRVVAHAGSPLLTAGNAG